MNTNIDGAIQTKVYTTPDGRVAIEQSQDAIVLHMGPLASLPDVRARGLLR